jgi:hypothetical protein
MLSLRTAASSGHLCVLMATVLEARTAFVCIEGCKVEQLAALPCLHVNYESAEETLLYHSI